jgi:TatD DNase family protein
VNRDKAGRDAMAQDMNEKAAPHPLHGSRPVPGPGPGVQGASSSPEPGLVTGPLVDSHCHLAFEAFDADREAVVERARKAGVVGCLIVAVDGPSARAARALAGRLPGWGRATAGIHPTEAAVTDEAAWRDVLDLFEEGGFAAVGETGLDAYHPCASLDDQAASLHRHLRLAADRQLPVILHCRDAFPRMARELQAWRGSGLRGVLHCFTGTSADVPPLLEAGLHVGVGGAATYKANTALRDAVREVPMERLLLETDAPWLAPVPLRGRRNEPAFVAHVAARLADDRNVPRASLAAATTANARALFGLPAPEAPAGPFSLPRPA